MNPRHPALPALAALLAGLAPRGGRAAEHDCGVLAVDADAGMRGRWPDLLERIQGELAARTDIDACAHVALRLERDGAVGVTVTLPDGRATARNVARRDDVIPTLQALLLVPEVGPAAMDVPAPPAVLAAAPAPAPAAVQPRKLRTTRSALHDDWPASAERDFVVTAPRAPRAFGFELSAISGVRLGGGQFAYGAGMLSFLEAHHWLFGFEGRADGYRSLRGSDPETALELAILAGRRLDFGKVALDLTVGPAVAMQGFALSQTQSARVDSMPGSAQPMPPVSPPPEHGEGPAPRLLLGARLGFSPRSVFRTFVGIDGEVGPTRDAAVLADPTVARLPAFSLGLALGATVGTP